MSQTNVPLPFETWLTDDDWVRVHQSFRPNVVDIRAFKVALLEGDPNFLKLDQLRKVVAVVREMLLERGRILEAKAQGWHQNKALLYTHLLTCLSIHSETKSMSNIDLNIDGQTGLNDSAPAAPKELSIPESHISSVPSESVVRLSRGHTSNHRRPSPPLDSAESDLTNGTPYTLGRPIQSWSDRIPERKASGSATAIICAPSTADEPLGTTENSTNEESSSKKTGFEIPRCLNGFSYYCSPLLPIVLEIKRFYVHQGYTIQSFQIPPELASQIQSRKRRIILTPVQGAYTPAPWPHVKEFSVQVNNEFPRSTWRRQWGRKNVTTSYLVLDISHLLSHKESVQRLQLHSTANDYMATMVVSVAANVSPEELITSILEEPVTLRTNSMTWNQVLRSRYISYSGVREDNDCQEDDVIPTTAPTLSVKCPISQCPISIPMRGSLCDHLQPVDLNAYLRSSHIGSFWNCPICDVKVRREDIIVDRPLMAFLKTIPSSWRFLKLIVNDAGRNLKPSELSLEHFSWVLANRDPHDYVGESDSNISSDDERRSVGQKRTRGAAILGTTAYDAIEIE